MSRNLKLLVPDRVALPGYVDALRRGWSPDIIRGEAAIGEQLAAIDRDAASFLEGHIDRDAKGPPIVLPDGSQVSRLPGYRLWIWDGEFCGVIGLRWQPGSHELPSHVLGHIGYAVVPWKRNRGYATRALGLMLRHAAQEGLDHVQITTDVTNAASQRVIRNNRGVLVETFRAMQYGPAERYRFRVPTK
jgi:predicted acetyltransferase